MLNLGWSELFFIMILSILVIGPNEIPVIMRNLGRVVRRLNYLRFAMSRQFEDFLKEHDLHDIKDIGREVNFEAKRFERHEGAGFNEAEEDELENSPPTDVRHD